VRYSYRFLFAAVLAAGTSLGKENTAWAQDQMKVAAGQRGNWETSVAEVGQRAGIFARHNIELEIVYTQGSGETMQTVISGAVDVGVGASLMAVLGAYARNAPVRVIGAASTGARDLFWYVRSDSPLQSISEAEGRTVAYSTTGASTHEIVKAFSDQYGIEFRPTPTGSPASTMTQVMAGLVDVGWSAPPVGLEQQERGEIRIIASGNDAVRYQGQTVRVLAVNARKLNADPDLYARFMAAYRETLDWMYGSPEGLATYAEFSGVTEARAQRIRDDFFPWESIDPDKIVGVGETMQSAIELGYVSAPLSQDRIDELIRVPADE
jgi:NitT/TauT family transport system substrate-binding protein